MKVASLRMRKCRQMRGSMSRSDTKRSKYVGIACLVWWFFRLCTTQESRSMEIVTSQVDVESESPPTNERSNSRKEDSLIEHAHVNKRPHLLGNTAGSQVGIPGVFVQEERKPIQTVNDSASQEKPVSPRLPDDQTEPHAQE